MIVATKIFTKSKSILICCVYNPPTRSPFLWPSGQLSNLLNEIELTRSNQFCENLILTGDIIFFKTDWESMCSSDDYENAFNEKLFELNFSNIDERQLDVVLADNLDPIISCDLDNNPYSKYSTNQRPCSDHIPIYQSALTWRTLMAKSCPESSSEAYKYHESIKKENMNKE